MLLINVKKVLVSVAMVITWLVMFGTLINAPSLKGKVAIISTGLLVNSLLALYYSCLDRRPTSFREWLRM